LILKIGEKSSLVDDFLYDFMMILDSGLLFLGHPVEGWGHMRSPSIARRHWWDDVFYL